jgi:tetratricopeptide (TPR) repeat protein
MKIYQITIIVAVLCFLGIFFGFDRKPINHLDKIEKETVSLEKSKMEGSSSLENAYKSISKETKESILALEKEIKSAPKSKTGELQKKLSGIWFSAGQPVAAAIVAEEVAKMEKTGEAWFIAGSTFYEGLRKSSIETDRTFAMKKAVECFENSLSLNPQSIEYKTGLALCYTEMPQSDNPMKGILMLIDLNKQNPENTLVLNNLGRLAIKTGQWEKALTRLEKANSIDPKNPVTNCLLAEAYEATGNKAQATKFGNLCKNSNNN